MFKCLCCQSRLSSNKKKNKERNELKFPLKSLSCRPLLWGPDPQWISLLLDMVPEHLTGIPNSTCPNRTHLCLPLKLKANFRKPSGYFMPPNCTFKNGSNDSFYAIYIYLTTIKQFFPLTTSGPSPSDPVSVNSSALHLHSEREPVTHPWPSSRPTGPVNYRASDS